MPTYTYFCNKCSCKFELFFSIAEYDPNPKCVGCKSGLTERSYKDDMQNMMGCVKKSDSELKTVGDLANRNRDRMPDDQKKELYNKHNSYKEEAADKPLPKGMTRLKKQNKIKWT